MPTTGQKIDQRQRGFSLFEVPQALILIGVLAVFIGLPRMLESVERSKATEAFAYLDAVRDAQQRYQAESGQYCVAINDLDMDQITPAYFSVGDIESGPNETGWSLTLKRVGGRSSGFGTYTVTFTDKGYDPSSSNIVPLLRPRS